MNAARTSGYRCGATFYPAVPALTWNAQLEAASRAHSQDMADRNFFSHTGSDGSNAGQRLTRAGYPWSTWGENIAAGQADVAEVVAGWLASEGHCVNIVRSSFTEMGAALVRSSTARYPTFWTQEFGRR